MLSLLNSLSVVRLNRLTQKPGSYTALLPGGLCLQGRVSVEFFEVSDVEIGEVDVHSTVHLAFRAGEFSLDNFLRVTKRAKVAIKKLHLFLCPLEEYCNGISVVIS